MKFSDTSPGRRTSIAAVFERFWNPASRIRELPRNFASFSCLHVYLRRREVVTFFRRRCQSRAREAFVFVPFSSPDSSIYFPAVRQSKRASDERFIVETVFCKFVRRSGNLTTFLHVLGSPEAPFVWSIHNGCIVFCGYRFYQFSVIIILLTRLQIWKYNFFRVICDDLISEFRRS